MKGGVKVCCWWLRVGNDKRVWGGVAAAQVEDNARRLEGGGERRGVGGGQPAALVSCNCKEVSGNQICVACHRSGAGGCVAGRPSCIPREPQRREILHESLVRSSRPVDSTVKGSPLSSPQPPPLFLCPPSSPSIPIQQFTDEARRYQDRHPLDAAAVLSGSGSGLHVGAEIPTSAQITHTNHHLFQSDAKPRRGQMARATNGRWAANVASWRRSGAVACGAFRGAGAWFGVCVCVPACVLRARGRRRTTSS